jgi:hypothetical protein
MMDFGFEPAVPPTAQALRGEVAATPESCPFVVNEAVAVIGTVLPMAGEAETAEAVSATPAFGAPRREYDVEALIVTAFGVLATSNVHMRISA